MVGVVWKIVYMMLHGRRRYEKIWKSVSWFLDNPFFIYRPIQYALLMYIEVNAGSGNFRASKMASVVMKVALYLHIPIHWQ